MENLKNVESRALRTSDHLRRIEEEESTLRSMEDECHDYVSSIREKIEGELSVEEKKSLVEELMYRLTGIPKYTDEISLLHMRDDVLDKILPACTVSEKPPEGDQKHIGWVDPNYYEECAAFTSTYVNHNKTLPIESKVIGAPGFYPHWAQYHENQQLFVLPGIAHVENSSENQRIETLEAHMLRTAKLACLYLEGDYIHVTKDEEGDLMLLYRTKNEVVSPSE